MARSTTLAVKIISDSRGASRGFQEAEGRVAGFQRRVDSVSPAMGRAALGVAGLGVAAFQMASDLQQSSGAVESVFGAQAAAVESLAKRAAQANGLSQNSYQELASVIGSQLGNMGIAHDQLVPKTDQLIDLGADLAATYGGTTADAVAALSSLLRGETDPIERYGVSIKQSDINARLAAQGLTDLEGPAAKAAQAQAVLGLLTEQTGSAMGAFGRENDTAAGQLQRAKAEAENAGAALGESLLPFVTTGAEALASFATMVKENADWIVPLVGILGLFAAAVWAVNFAMAANPFTLVAIAIGAIVAAVVIAYQKFEWFRDLVSAIGSFFSTVFDGFITAIEWVVDQLSWIGDAVGVVSGWFSAPAVAPGPGGGAAAGGRAFFGGPGGAMRGASIMSGLGGGNAPAAAQAPGQQTIINVTVNGAVDPMSAGRQIVGILREYGVASGGQVAISIGGR